VTSSTRCWAARLQACKLDDEYPNAPRFATGLRFLVKLQIGQEEPYNRMLIESVGLTVISEAYKTQET